MPIKDWNEDDKPREKLMTKGADACTVAELIAIIITNGTTKKSAVELGAEIMHNCNDNLVQFVRSSLKDYQEVAGIGPAKACIIKAAAELGRRIADAKHSSDDDILIKCTEDAVNMMRFLREFPNEEFWVILTTNSGSLITKRKVGVGNGGTVVVDMRKLVSLVVDKSASRVILCHNHPGGTMQPSQEDINITNDIKTMLRFVQVSVVEHIIICGDDYFSFLENHLM